MSSAHRLTPRSYEVLRYLRRYINTHGWAPTFSEIGTDLGMASKSTVSHHLTQLERAGHIQRERGVGSARAIRVLPR